MEDATIPWNKNDSLFAQECATGYGWQMFAAGYLAANNLPVVVSSLKIRDNIQNRKEFKDNGDLFIGERIVECKARSLEFTSPEDFPFETIFVDTVHNWKEKAIKPFAYICISKITMKMIATNGLNPHRWIITRKHDSVRNIRDDFYSAPRSEWRPISKLIDVIREL